MTISSIVLFDGVATATLTDGTNYALTQKGWAPAACGLRPGRGGGRGPYDDVEEQLTIDIIGTSMTTLLSNHIKLVQLLDRAARWWRGDALGSGPVLLRVTMTGGSAHEAIVIGGEIRAPANYADLLNGFELEKATLRLVRRGRWLNTSPDGVQTSAAAAVANLMSVSGLSDLVTTSPVGNFWLAGFSPSATPIIAAGYLATTDEAAALTIQNMSTATAANYTTQADSANLPRGGTNVLRYTPPDSFPIQSGTITGIVASQVCPVAILAVCRNNHASRVFQIRANLGNKAGVLASTPYQPVLPGGNVPQIVRLGIVRHPYAWDRLSITCQVDSNTGSPTLDIDYLVLVSLRNETCRLMQHDALTVSALTATIEFEIRNIENTNERVPSWRVYGNGADDIAPVSYYDAIDLQCRSTAFYSAWFATGGARWRFVNTSNAVPTLTANLQRHPAYLTLQL